MKTSLTVLLAGLLLTIPMAVNAQEVESDAFAILNQVRDTYRNLKGYHFEHKIEIEEMNPAGESAQLTALTLVTASDAAEAFVDGKPGLPFNEERCFMEIGTERGNLAMGCAASAAWRYCSTKQEYMRGNAVDDVMNPASTKMFDGIHMNPFVVAAEESIQDAKLLREETVTVGGEQRGCTVIELLLKLSISMTTQDAGTVPPTSFLNMLQMHEMFDATDFILFDQEVRPTYNPRPRIGEPSRITLWIDKEQNVIVRRTITETATRRLPRDSEGKREVEEVVLKLDDTFTVINLTRPLPDELFRFTPPPEATEIKSEGGRHGYF